MRERNSRPRFEPGSGRLGITGFETGLGIAATATSSVVSILLPTESILDLELPRDLLIFILLTFLFRPGTVLIRCDYLNLSHLKWWVKKEENE